VISGCHNTTLVKAIRIIYGSDLVPTSSSNIEMSVDVLKAKSFSGSKNKILLIL